MEKHAVLRHTANTANVHRNNIGPGPSTKLNNPAISGVMCAKPLIDQHAVLDQSQPAPPAQTDAHSCTKVLCSNMSILNNSDVSVYMCCTWVKCEGRHECPDAGRQAGRTPVFFSAHRRAVCLSVHHPTCPSKPSDMLSNGSIEASS